MNFDTKHRHATLISKKLMARLESDFELIAMTISMKIVRDEEILAKMNDDHDFNNQIFENAYSEFRKKIADFYMNKKFQMSASK